MPTLPIHLLRHYPTDAQESMRRYADLLRNALDGAGHHVIEHTPAVRVGAVYRSAHGLGKYLGYVDKYLLFPRELRRAKAEPDAVFAIPDHSHGMYVPLVADRPHVVHVHDLLAIQSARGEIPEHPTGWSGRLYQRWIARGLARARHIICVSRYTADEFRCRFPDSPAEVRVIPNGLNFEFFPDFRPQVLDRLQISRDVPFLLHVGGNQWYKNRLGVLQIFQAHCQRYPDVPLQLVLVGKEPPAALRRFIADHGIGEIVHFRSDVSNEDLRALYSQAAALLFPSRREGFGWPIAEAHACGTTVFTTQAPPMTEVGGDAAEYLPLVPHDPATVDSWAAESAGRIARFLAVQSSDSTDRRERNLANARRFDPAPLQREIARVYEEVASRATRPEPTPR